MRIHISDVIKNAGLLFLLMFITISGHAAALVVGKIAFVRGSNAAQRPGEAPRILGKGTDIFQGDNIQTSERSFVIIEFTDGAKVTVRPNSSFSIDQYDQQAKTPKAQLTLHEGGLRASSGDIAKSDPENFQIKTELATVKAQQADYSVRLCKQDCEQEKQQTQTAQSRTDQSVVARVADIKGEVRAINRAETDAKERLLSLGGPLYSADYLHSQKDSYVLMVFRDGEKITLEADSEMDIAQYHYQHNGEKDRALYRLRAGGMRSLTGSIGKTNKDAYAVDTPVGTIGIRGTGFDLSCVGDCINENKAKIEEAHVRTGQSEGLYSHVWQGQIALVNETGEHLFTMPETNYIASRNDEAMQLPQMPEGLINMVIPRPDKDNSDLQKLFGAAKNKGTPSGLYVTVHSGHIKLARDSARSGTEKAMDLGKDEAGYVNPQKGMTRLSTQQAFQTDDFYPLPNKLGEQKDMSDYSLLNDAEAGGAACQSP